MNLAAALPSTPRWLFVAAYGLVLLVALRSAPWRRLAEPALLKVWLGAIVTVLALWQVKAGIKPGLDLHLIGASALTLIAGPQLAIIGLSAVLLVSALLGTDSLAGSAYAGLMLIAAPVAVTGLIVHLCARYLPRHLFIFLFVPVFFGTALATALTALAVYALLAVASVYPAQYLYSDYLPYFLLLAWPEALLTGMALTLMTVFRPTWVASFEDRPHTEFPRRR